MLNRRPVLIHICLNTMFRAYEHANQCIAMKPTKYLLNYVHKPQYKLYVKLCYVLLYVILQMFIYVFVYFLMNNK